MHFGDNSLFQNAVGYSKAALNDGGAKMVGTPFTVVGATDKGFWLSDLIPQGYLDNCDYRDDQGIDGQFAVQILSSSGHADAIYSWVHPAKKGSWKDGQHWNDPSSEEVEPRGENDLFITPGTGLWFYAPDRSEEDPDAIYSVTPAGEVSKDTVKFSLRSGATACSNPFPCDIWLSDLIPEGYLDNCDYRDDQGIDGQFAVQLLSKSGHADAIYSWVHPAKKGSWKDGQHWNDPASEEIDPHGDNDLKITAGMGLWIYAPDRSEEDLDADYFINVNYPTAD